MIVFRFNIVVAVLALVMLQDISVAQEGDVFSFFDGNRIHLRWRGARSIVDPHYILVREDVQERRRDTLSTPDLHRHSKAADIHRIAGTQAGAYFGLFRSADADIEAETYRRVFNDKTSTNLFGAIAAATPSFARVLGEIYVDSSIVIGHSYRYRVIVRLAKDSTTIGQTGVVQTNLPEQVPIPSGVEALSQDQSCSLSWDRSSADARTGSVVSWNVYRSDALLKAGVRINAMPILAMDFGEKSLRQYYKDDYLTNGQHYFYSLRAVNVTGIESAPSPSIEVVPSVPLSAPTKLRARQVGDNVMLEWESGLLSSGDCYFRVHRVVKSSGAISIDTCPGMSVKGVVTFLDRQPPLATALAYTVQSVCGDEWSATSDTTLIICQDHTPPRNPMNLRAQAKKNKVILEWDQSTDADIMGYNVYRVHEIASDDIVSMKLNAQVVTTNTYSVDVTEQDPHYLSFSVSAVDKAYNESTTSIVRTRLEDNTAPPVPVITNARFRDSLLFVSWSLSAAEDLREYNVYLVGNDGITFHLGHTRSLSYELITHPTIPFRVRVSAIDSSGNESALSDPRSFDPSLYTAPAAPQLVEVKEQENSIVIRWKPVYQSSVAGFGVWKVEADGSRVSMKELPATASEFIDEISDPGRDQHYVIRAFSAEGLLSADTEVRYQPKK